MPIIANHCSAVSCACILNFPISRLILLIKFSITGSTPKTLLSEVLRALNLSKLNNLPCNSSTASVALSVSVIIPLKKSASSYPKSYAMAFTISFIVINTAFTFVKMPALFSHNKIICPDQVRISLNCSPITLDWFAALSMVFAISPIAPLALIWSNTATILNNRFSTCESCLIVFVPPAL